MCTVATIQVSIPTAIFNRLSFFPLYRKKIEKKEGRGAFTSTHYILFSLLCQVMRNKETENRALNSLCSDQIGLQTKESPDILLFIISRDNLTMSKNVPFDPRLSSITRAPRLRIYCASYFTWKFLVTLGQVPVSERQRNIT